MLRTQAASRVVRQALARTQVRGNATRALSNPMLNNIEKRWESMPLQEQAELWMALRDRMQGSWKELTEQEKRAGGFPLPLPPRYPFASLLADAVVIPTQLLARADVEANWFPGVVLDVCCGQLGGMARSPVYLGYTTGAPGERITDC